MVGTTEVDNTISHLKKHRLNSISGVEETTEDTNKDWFSILRLKQDEITSTWKVVILFW